MWNCEIAQTAGGDGIRPSNLIFAKLWRFAAAGGSQVGEDALWKLWANISIDYSKYSKKYESCWLAVVVPLRLRQKRSSPGKMYGKKDPTV